MALNARGGGHPKTMYTANMNHGKVPLTRAFCDWRAKGRFIGSSAPSENRIRSLSLSMRRPERKWNPQKLFSTSCGVACRRPLTTIPSVLASLNALQTAAWQRSCATISLISIPPAAPLSTSAEPHLYLKSQRKGLEAQFTPEAAKDYAALLSEIRSTEQEISDPSYANHLIQYRSEYSQLKEKLEQCQNEREGLLEKAAKGRQILEGSQFSDKDSVQEYLDHTRKLYQEYSAIKTAYQKGSRRGWNIFFFFLAFAASMGTALCLTVPRLVLSLLPLAPAPVAVAAGTAAAVFLLCAFIQSHKERRLKKELEKSAQLLQEIFSKHLGDSSISKEAMDALEGRMAEFLRLSKALRQSEDTLARLSQEMKDLKNSQEHFSQEIEEQQRIQWELEQKLEHSSVCREQAERLRRVLTENERIQEELDAIDLAQETITSLSASIRDSFGFYLNKEASDLISGITGGIYTSMSINENLEVFMNTPTKLVPINQVSSGTMDQIYLALRLAAAKLIQNGRSDTMPLIFDDSFVLYDDDRLKTALKWLSRAFKGQIIIFTCHQREAQLLTANQVKYHLIQIDASRKLDITERLCINWRI